MLDAHRLAGVGHRHVEQGCALVGLGSGVNPALPAAFEDGQGVVVKASGRQGQLGAGGECSRRVLHAAQDHTVGRAGAELDDPRGAVDCVGVEAADAPNREISLLLDFVVDGDARGHTQARAGKEERSVLLRHEPPVADEGLDDGAHVVHRADALVLSCAVGCCSHGGIPCGGRGEGARTPRGRDASAC